MTDSVAAREGEVLDVRQLSPTVLQVVVQGPPDYQWLPGQHLALESTTLGEKPKYFSIASARSVSHPGRFELAVGGTDADRAPFVPGLRFELSAPAGPPCVEPGTTPRSLVLIAMGTGIAPLRATIQDQITAPASRDDARPALLLLHGCRTLDELLFQREFESYQSDGYLEYRPVVSRPAASWRGLRGRVQAHLDALPFATLSTTRFCVCGSLAMVEETTRRLASAGVQSPQLFAQGY